MADITLGQFYNAIAQGAREATLEALKGKDFATQTTLAQVKQVLDTLNGAVSTSAGQADIQQAIAALAGIVAKESTLGQAKSALDAISGKVATDQGVGLVASAVEALAQIAATESTLTQAVQKLESIVSRLQNPLTVDGEVQLKGRLGTDVPNPVVSEIPTTTLTDPFPNNVADLMHSPSNVPMVVDWVMIASNSPALIILMEPRDAAGAVNRRKTVGQGFVNLNGTPNFHTIRDGYYPGWEIVEWNREANLYKARFTGPAYWPFGGRIRLQKGGSSPTIQVAATWSYRLMEVVNHE